jgi:hypothetical protein
MEPATAPARPVTLLALAGAVTLAAVLWVQTRDLPFFGDSSAWLSAVAGFDSPLYAFDPALAVYRPAQHLVLWFLVHTGLDRSGFALVPGLVLHVCFVLAVLKLARTLQLDRRGQGAAVATILCFPAVHALDWVVAVSTPARALCTVLAVDAAIRHARAPRRATGLAIVGWSLASMLAHEQGFATAGLAAVAWWRCRPVGSRVRFDVWIGAGLAFAAAWAAFLLLRPSRVHAVKQLAALPANVAHAVLAFAPADLRIFSLEALRGHHGVGMTGLVLVAGAGAAALLVWKTHRLGRTLLLLTALDCLLAVASTGFSQRYAYGPAAFVALGIGAAWSDWQHVLQPRRIAIAIASCVLWLLWLQDAREELAEARAGGAIVRAVTADAIAVRQSAPSELLLIDLPPDTGREQGVGLFRWGGRELLKRVGLGEPFTCVCTQIPSGGTDMQLVDDAAIARRVAAGAIALRFDERTVRLIRSD